MLSTYLPPTKWYRREYAWHFKVVLWPAWIARWLCNHELAITHFDNWLGKPVSREQNEILEVEQALDMESKKHFTLPCPDCGMFVIRSADGKGVYPAFHR